MRLLIFALAFVALAASQCPLTPVRYEFDNDGGATTMNVIACSLDGEINSIELELIINSAEYDGLPNPLTHTDLIYPLACYTLPFNTNDTDTGNMCDADILAGDDCTFTPPPDNTTCAASFTTELVLLAESEAPIDDDWFETTTDPISYEHLANALYRGNAPNASKVTCTPNGDDNVRVVGFQTEEGSDNMVVGVCSLWPFDTPSSSPSSDLFLTRLFVDVNDSPEVSLINYPDIQTAPNGVQYGCALITVNATCFCDGTCDFEDFNCDSGALDIVYPTGPGSNCTGNNTFFNGSEYVLSPKEFLLTDPFHDLAVIALGLGTTSPTTSVSTSPTSSVSTSPSTSPSTTPSTSPSTTPSTSPSTTPSTTPTTTTTTTPLTCPAGQFSNTTFCLPCEIGTHLPLAGTQTECDPCPGNTFANTTETANCTACQDDTGASTDHTSCIGGSQIAVTIEISPPTLITAEFAETFFRQAADSILPNIVGMGTVTLDPPYVIARLYSESTVLDSALVEEFVHNGTYAAGTSSFIIPSLSPGNLTDTREHNAHLKESTDDYVSVLLGLFVVTALAIAAIVIAIGRAQTIPGDDMDETLIPYS